MITVEEVKAAIKARGDVPHFHNLCFRHPDIRVRAGYQESFVWLANGGTGGRECAPEADLRATPAGRKIPLNESPFIQPAKRCGPDGCKAPGPGQWLEEDAE